MSALRSLCPHFGDCGGCSVQNLSQQDYIAYKLDKIQKPLKHVRDIHQFQLHPLEQVQPATRRRVVLKAQRLAKKVILGFHQRQSHHIVDLQTCFVVVPEIERLLTPLRTFLMKLMPLSAKAEIFVLKCDQGLDVAIESPHLQILSLEQREHSADFAQQQKLIRLTVHHDPICIQQKSTIHFGKHAVDVTPYAFLQASETSDQWLADQVCSFVPKGATRIADLFCGRGTLTLPLSYQGAVDAFKFDATALEALRQTSQIHQRPIKTYKRQLFKDPLQAFELTLYQMVVINPPRTGAYAQVQQIAMSQVACLVYVSCHPKTFARDAKILINCGFILDDIYPFDQFLWSDHIELVAVFKR